MNRRRNLLVAFGFIGISVLGFCMLSMYSDLKETNSKLDCLISQQSAKSTFIHRHLKEVKDKKRMDEAKAYRVLSAVWEYGVMRHNLEPELVLSVINRENPDWNVCVKSRLNRNDDYNGEGLMQVLPSVGYWVAERIGMEDYDAFDIEDNISVGCAHLKWLVGKYGERDALRFWYAGTWAFTREPIISMSVGYAKDVLRGKKDWSD